MKDWSQNSCLDRCSVGEDVLILGSFSLSLMFEYNSTVAIFNQSRLFWLWTIAGCEMSPFGMITSADQLVICFSSKIIKYLRFCCFWFHWLIHSIIYILAWHIKCLLLPVYWENDCTMDLTHWNTSLTNPILLHSQCNDKFRHSVTFVTCHII